MTRAVTFSMVLEREHDAIDSGLEQLQTSLQRGARETAPFVTAAAALRRHIYMEEDFLFPLLRTGGLVAPVAVMLREHGEIWRTLDSIEALLDTQAAPEVILRALGVLLGHLGEHNLKEERIVYPALDQLVAGEHAHELLGQIEVAELPPAWVCEALRE